MMNKARIENILLEIGIPAGAKGFKYITDAVMIMDERPIDGITKDLYPSIAERNSTTPSRVERSIRHAFETARSPKGNHDAVEHYIGFVNCENNNSLKMLHIKIKQESESEEKEEEKRYRTVVSTDEIREIVREELKKVVGGIE